MKCQNCKSNLNIEDKFCPYCGMPNPFAQEHQRELEKFTQDYNETKEEVIRKTGAKGRRAGRITIIAILAVLIIVLVLLISNSYEFRYMKEAKAVEKNKAEYTRIVEGYIAEDEFLELGYFATEKGLRWSDSFEDYSRVFECASYYRSAYTSCVQLMQYDSEKYNYATKNELIEDVAEHLHRMFESRVRSEYDREELFSDGKSEAMDRNVNQAVLLVKMVFGLSDEEAEALPTMSESRLNVLLEDRYEQKN